MISPGLTNRPIVAYLRNPTRLVKQALLGTSLSPLKILFPFFRSDITTILLSTLSFLWFCSKSVSFLLDPQSSAAPFPAIHRLCSCLLTTLVKYQDLV